MHIFLSYAKKDTRTFALNLQDALRQLPGVTVWMDESLKVGSQWPRSIEREIERCDVMLVLLSPDVNREETPTQQVSFVIREIDCAQDLHKKIIPLMVQKTRIPIQLRGIQYADFTVDEARAWEQLTAELGHPDAPMLVTSLYAQRLAAPPARPSPPPTQLPSAAKSPKRDRRGLWALGAAAAVIGIAAGVLALNGLLQQGAGGRLQSAATETSTPSMTVSPRPEGEGQGVRASPTLDPLAEADRILAETQAAYFAFQTQTVEAFTDTPTATATETPDFTQTVGAALTLRAEQTNAAATLTATVWTPTPIPLGYPGNPVTANAQWTPVYATFNGVEMALVPAGCFRMGSEDGADDERPVHEICFEQPFWIDRTEVTNAQYGSSGRFSGDNRPRETVNWFAARDFCASRGARLPTEAEWEYAARGPDGLVYPWGNAFVAENVVYYANSNDQTADVGSRPGGASWVGALDLSGNVWEWVSSLYRPYPYNVDDGRESNEDANSARGLRGGSWDNYEDVLRAANRFRNVPTNEYNNLGFRCARPFNPDLLNSEF